MNHATSRRNRQQLSLTVPSALVSQVDERSPNRSAAVELMLRRSLDLYQSGRQTLVQVLTQEDIEAIVAAAKEELESDPNGLLDRYFNVAPKIADQELAMKLSQLPRSQQFALADAIERWWNLHGRNGAPPKLEEVLFR